MYHCKRLIGSLAFLVSLCSLRVMAKVDFMACLDSARSGRWGLIGGTDERGQPVSNITLAAGLTYDMCIRACGAAPERVQWSIFSQQLGSWLFPWLALLSQLPYGASDPLENLMSMLLTVGSPALVGYSLVFTALNGRWISRRLAPLENLNPSAKYATHVLTALQQYPLRVNHGEFLTSLAILPENHEWWKNLAQSIRYTPTWTISVIVSMVWVAIAYLFTIINSLLDDFNMWVNRNGQGIGSQWLWLMPIVPGWVTVSPEFDAARFPQAVRNATSEVYVLQNGILTLHDMAADPIISIPDDMYDNIHGDERCTIPICNYARFLTWADSVERILQAFQGSPESDRQGLGGLGRVMVSSIVGHRAMGLHRISINDQIYGRGVPVGGALLIRLLIASFFGLFLQWGTTGGAIVIHWFTPTYGLGCRTASLLLYGMLATLVWAMLVLSSVLSYYSTRISTAKRTSRSARVSRFFSILLRRTGKTIAVFNAIWVILSSIFQFSNVFDSCWCNSSALGLQSKAYTIIDYSHFDLTGTRAAWISGMALAAVTAFIFILFVNSFTPMHH